MSDRKIIHGGEDGWAYDYYEDEVPAERPAPSAEMYQRKYESRVGWLRYWHALTGCDITTSLIQAQNDLRDALHAWGYK